ncbi:unnamed protein product [Caenorhabditis auriculariae]|uniref:Serpentine receptor class gamma n=1 Tax=Caenorhabditis auriculariae TaxID=2777116 RepID=A0A8S1GTL0_9PELO|nr:unnamed protein product [Caenorhabditis auriculariae]
MTNTSYYSYDVESDKFVTKSTLVLNRLIASDSDQVWTTIRKIVQILLPFASDLLTFSIPYTVLFCSSKLRRKMKLLPKAFRITPISPVITGVTPLERRI